MKLLSWSIPSALAALVLMVQSFALVAAETSDKRNALDDKLIHLEELWKSGTPREYYMEADRIAKELHSQAQEAANAGALRLLNAVAAKSPRPEDAVDIEVADLSAVEQSARLLLGDDDVPDERRQEKVRLLAWVLGRIRLELVPAYVPQSVVMNVLPPAGAGKGPIIAGVDPETIRDPAARERYKAAIRENQAKAVQNTRQRTLQGMEMELARPIVGYLSRAAREQGEVRQAVLQSIDQARLTANERAEIVQPRD
jgi:hypothetical protein